MAFLPINKEDLEKRGIDTLDFIVVSADAYVDHPSFGHAIIARLVESQGFLVGIIAQPQTDSDYLALGMPKKAFLVAGGVCDSMVNNYTVAKNRRNEDVYSQNGKFGKRPDRATQVYTKNLKRLFPDVCVIIGGIEASLRRLSHYDYWDDSVRHSILYDCPCDLLVYGMGENPIIQLCDYAKKGIPLDRVKDICGTAYLTDKDSASKAVKRAIEGDDSKYIILSSHDRVASDKKLYAKAFMIAQENTDPFCAKGMIQKQDYTSYAVINPCSPLLGEQRMDSVYNLPFERAAHPHFAPVPAIEEVKFSVTAHRGCYGNCSFCALNYHQGKIIQSRSTDNIVAEVEKLASLPDFKGYIHDIGGPSANFHAPSCQKQDKNGACVNRDCIGSKPCKNLRVDHSKYLEVLRRARSVKGVKRVFVRSGVRFDYLMMDSDKTFFNELVKYHISGQLKVAPEHVGEKTLSAMNKPSHQVYLDFCEEFKRLNTKHSQKQFLVPYLVSSHPACTTKEAVALMEYLMSINYMPLQVQDFYPTPSTLSTTMYYTELDPKTMQPIYVAKTKEEKSTQRALMQYRLKKNKPLIEKVLLSLKREDLLKKLRRYWK